MTTTATAEPAPAAPAQIEWNLAEIYDSLDAWRADKARLEQAVEGLARFKGRLGESAATLSEALDAISATEKDLVRLYVFAFLKADEDRRVSEAQERRGEATLLLAAFEEATSFVSPELLRVGSETIKGYLDAEPRLARHAFNVRNILRKEPHTLSDEAEAVIAGTSAMRQGPERVFAMLTSSDMPFPTVTLATGEEVRLDQAAYGKHRASRDRGRPQAGLRRVLEGVEGLHGDAGTDARHAREGARVRGPVAALRQRARRGAGRTEHPGGPLSDARCRGQPASPLPAPLFRAAPEDARTARAPDVRG